MDDKVYVISVLKEGCFYCKEYKELYWNNSQDSWKKLVEKFGFIPWTIEINNDNYEEIIQNFKKNGVTYINTYPFIFAAIENRYDANDIFAFCCTYNNNVKKFIYNQGNGPCRTNENFIKFLKLVKNKIYEK